MKNINTIVRKQILAEAPQLGGAAACNLYIDSAINEMSQVELLQRISDAIASAATEDP